MAEPHYHFYNGANNKNKQSAVSSSFIVYEKITINQIFISLDN